MGTRSLTIFNDETGNEICVLYKQYDGYFSGWGKDLAEWLSGKKVVNGCTPEDTKNKNFNGMNGLAVQTIAHFCEDKPGQFYLYPANIAGTIDLEEEYIYAISLRDGRPFMEVVGSDGTFSGFPEDFDASKF